MTHLLNNKLNVALFSVSASGKSYLINKLLGKNVAKIGEISKVNRTTHDITTYEYNQNIYLHDTPGIFEATCNTHNDIRIFIKNTFSRIDKIDYVLMIIPYTNNGVRQIDILSMLVLEEFSNLKDRIIVYISKTDLSINRKLLDKYFEDIKFRLPISNLKIYTDAFVIQPGITSIRNDNHKIFETVQNKNLISITECIQQDSILPLINNIQNHMLANNLYPPDYVRNYNGGFIRKLLSGLVKLYKMPFNFPNDENNITLTLFYSNDEVTFRYIKNRDVIRYENGAIFYQGTFHGNNFDVGTFYDPQGNIIYEKDC